MGIIRIVKIPEGDAPLEIREAWVGLELPCLTKHDESKEVKNIISQEIRQPRPNCWYVPQDMALEILEEAAPEAAQWWLEHDYPHPDRFFTFGEDEAELVDGVILVPAPVQ